MINLVETLLDNSILTSFLQKTLTFTLQDKVIKKGRLLLFKKSHYFIQFALQTNKKDQENLEIPFPFALEYYPDEELLYFDYRLNSLLNEDFSYVPQKINSIYFNKILELQVTL